MRIMNQINKIGLVSALVALPIVCVPNSARAQMKNDEFVKTELRVPPFGTSEKAILFSAPSPKIEIMGEVKNAKFVVDLKTNVLYKYDDLGEPECAYRIASGKPSTPTDKGVRIVTHTETYPYRTAPRSSKRRRNPRAYGPKIILLNKLNPKTGEQASTGEFIHGTNVPSSIGKYASHGCMRMDNEVIKQLSAEVQRGDIVIIK